MSDFVVTEPSGAANVTMDHQRITFVLLDMDRQFTTSVPFFQSIIKGPLQWITDWWAFNDTQVVYLWFANDF